MKYNDNGLWKTLNIKVTDTLPVGTIIPYAGTTIPSNYMKCEGQALSRIEYDILFSSIGTTYGVGDGTTTFNLPNLKGRVITGIDSNDTDFDTLGETGGEKTHTLTVEEMPSHSHDIGWDQTTNLTDPGQQGIPGQEPNNRVDGWRTFSTGGGQAHNIMQPYIVLNYIIKVLDAPATTQAQVVDGYSTSSRDSYSCNYVNGMNTYSTDEIRIGTWIDGKPIYRKVIARNITATNHTTISLSSLNIDELLTVKSINKKVSNNFTFYDNFFDSSNEKITLHYRNDIIEFWTADETNYTSTVWIEYTKTVD